MKKSVFVIEDSEEDEEDAIPVEEERGPLADTDISQRALKEEEQKCLLPIASPRGCNCWRYCVLMLKTRKKTILSNQFKLVSFKIRVFS